MCMRRPATPLAVVTVYLIRAHPGSLSEVHVMFWFIVTANMAIFVHYENITCLNTSRSLRDRGWCVLEYYYSNSTNGRGKALV